MKPYYMYTDKFNIILDCDWYKKGDTLVMGTPLQKVEVLETPRYKHSKWYWKVLNWITFRYFFNEVVHYKVRYIPNSKIF